MVKRAREKISDREREKEKGNDRLEISPSTVVPSSVVISPLTILVTILIRFLLIIIPLLIHLNKLHQHFHSQSL